MKCDVTSEDSVDQAIKKVMEGWGTIDVLVNCAGAVDNFGQYDCYLVPFLPLPPPLSSGEWLNREKLSPSPPENAGNTSNAIWNKCMDINVNGPFYLIRAVIPIFERTRKGSIVNICSVASVRGAAAGAAYTASKHALLGLSRNTAWMYAKSGIRSNAVIPGGVMTNIMANSGAQMDQTGQQVLGPYLAAMPGLSTPEDLAKAIVFVAGAEALNGAELHVDKGWTTA